MNHISARAVASFGAAVIVAVYVLLVVAFGFSHGMNLSLVFIAACFGSLFLFSVFQSFKASFWSECGTVWGSGPLVIFKMFCCSIGGASAFELLTLFGAPLSSPLDFHSWKPLRMAIFFVLIWMILALYLVKGKGSLFANAKACLARRDKRILLVILGGLACSVVLAILLSILFSGFFHISNFAFAVFAASLIIPCFSFFLFRHRLADRPELIFAVVAFFVGVSIAILPPAVTNISWDDQIHYSRSLALSYVIDPEYSEADLVETDTFYSSERVERLSAGGSWSREGWDAESVGRFTDALNDVASCDLSISEGFISPPPDSELVAVYSSLGYVPSAIGLWLGRLLHFPFSVMFVMGKLFNLISYIAVSAVAIRLIPVKKILLACLALIPTSLYMAGNFSYDAWLISFTFLAVAVIIKLALEPGLLSVGDYLTMAFILFLALGPKATYFPLIGLMFMMPKAKFSSNKTRVFYYIGVSTLALIVLLSFLIPFLAQGAGGDDMRGGEGVDSSSQLSLILANPFGFIAMLLRFFVYTYLPAVHSSEYTLMYAYLGDTGSIFPLVNLVPLMLLIVAALVDSSSTFATLAKLRHRIWVAFLCFASMALSATALYISFTPVGADTVQGFQYRYLLPVLFPFLAFVLNCKIAYVGNKNVLAGVLIGSMGLMGFICNWMCIVSVLVV